MTGRFLCWNCELWHGDEDAPVLPSQLCESCQAARIASGLVRTRTVGVDDDDGGAP